MSNSLPVREEADASTEESQVPLECLIKASKWDCVLERLKTERGKEEASQRVSRSFSSFPIHEACEKQDVPLKVINALLEAYPQGIQRTIGWARLPIHLAVCSRCSVDVVHRLIVGYPEGLQQKSALGDLPIHNALHKPDNSLDVIQRLNEAYPGGLQQQNDAEELPIHLAVKFNASTDVVMYLIEAYPEGLQQRDRDGMLPIHVATFCLSPSLNIIKILIEKDPMSVIQTCTKEVEVTYQLVEGCEEEVEVEIQDRFQRPLFYIGSPSFTFKRTTENLMPYALSFYNVRTNTFSRQEKQTDVISYLESEQRKHIVDLALDAVKQNEIKNNNCNKKQKA